MRPGTAISNLDSDMAIGPFDNVSLHNCYPRLI